MKDPTLYIFIRGTLFIEILNLIITSTLTIKLCKKIINRYFLFFHNKVVIFLIVKIIKFFWTSLFGSITKWSSNKKAGALLSYVNSVQNCIDNIDNIQHSPVQRIKFQSPFFYPESSKFTQILLYCSSSMFDENFPEMHHGYILSHFHDHKMKISVWGLLLIFCNLEIFPRSL